MLLVPDSLSPAMPVCRNSVPACWYIDKEYLEILTECEPLEDFGLPSAGATLTKHGLLRPLIKCTDTETGTRTYYLWRDISDDVARIYEPTYLDEIVSLLNDDVNLKVYYSEATELRYGCG